ncbi:MAG: diguanylate cyclase [Candidatus Riflebacteria bacterium]|nr:diguanylate cyclase [Candidatus Riflebacteria bacterium]
MKLLLKDQLGRIITEFPLLKGGNGVKIGRSAESDIQVASLSLAEDHVLVRYGSDGRVLLQDLQSSFGIIINGERTQPGFLKELPAGIPVQLSDDVFISLEKSSKWENSDAADTTFDSSQATVFPFFLERNRRQIHQIFAETRSGFPKEYLGPLQTLEKVVQERVTEWSAIIDTGFALNSVTSYGRLLEYVIDMALEVTKADYGRLILHNEEMDRLETMLLRRLNNKAPLRENRETDRFILECFHGHQILLKAPEDVSAATNEKLRRTDEALPPRPLALVPLRVQNTTIGVLHLERQDSSAPFPESTLDPLRIFAGQAALAIGHARLMHLATIDALTGLINHPHFHQRMIEEFARATRHQTPLSLLLLKIDHFDRVVKRHGDAVGDLVLKKLGRLLKSAMRIHDVAARYASDEFAILLPSTPSEGAKTVAEKLRLLITKAGFRIAKKTVKITISVGLAGPSPQIKKPMEWLRLAVTALKEAFDAGDGRIVMRPEESAFSPLRGV